VDYKATNRYLTLGMSPKTKKLRLDPDKSDRDQKNSFANEKLNHLLENFTKNNFQKCASFYPIIPHENIQQAVLDKRKLESQSQVNLSKPEFSHYNREKILALIKRQQTEPNASEISRITPTDLPASQ
jgi:hypothetical protein